MTVERFERLLKTTIGLDAASIGASAVRRAVQARILATSAADEDQYFGAVSASRAELQSLVEAVVVPETWFFRDPQAFAAMARLAVEGASRRSAAGARLRLLSLPCSTGEEPYSMAMALIDAGLPPDAFQIDAIDISHAALDQARRAIYGRNSFRGADLSYRERFFVPVERGHALVESVKGAVTFQQGNLFAGDLAGGPYDMIFCRNLLIYFDAADQQRAVRVLRRLLAADGTLFVGHSESSIPLEAGFASIRVPFAFAFRKATASLPRPATPARTPTPTVQSVIRKPALPPEKPFGPGRPAAERAPPAPREPRGAEVGLTEIRTAADRGDYPAALRLGEAYLRARPESPEALRLMGVVSEAAGETAAAARYYRQALYLEPNDAEALAHLALLLERQGDAGGARLMRERARRVRAPSGA